MWVTLPKHKMFGHELFQEIVMRLSSCLLVCEWVNISLHFTVMITVLLGVEKNTVVIKINNIALQDISRACLLCGLKLGPNPWFGHDAHVLTCGAFEYVMCWHSVVDKISVESTVLNHGHCTSEKSSMCEGSSVSRVLKRRKKGRKVLFNLEKISVWLEPSIFCVYSLNIQMACNFYIWSNRTKPEQLITPYISKLASL